MSHDMQAIMQRARAEAEAHPERYHEPPLPGDPDPLGIVEVQRLLPTIRCINEAHRELVAERGSA